MSDFKDIINYLRFSRRSEDAQAKNKNRIAIVVNKAFDNNIPHEDDIVVIKKRVLTNGIDYRHLNDVANTYVTTLYIIDQPNGVVEYYVKKDFEEDGVMVPKYKRVPLSESTSEAIWENKEDTVFTAINVTSDFYYRPEDQKVYMVFSEDVFLFPDTFIYNPKDLSEDSAYEFDFIDAEGFSNSAWDTILQNLYSPIYAAIAKQKRIVNLEKKPEAKIVNLFPRIENNGTSLLLHYNYYEKGIPFDSKGVGTPAITLRFKHVGALLEFLNKTIFYILTEQSDFHTNLRKIFIDNYNWFISDLVRYNKGNALLRLFYFLPELAFQHLDDLNLWDIVDNMLENAVTNIGLDKETILLKLLGVLHKNSKTDQIFLQELLKQNAKKETRLERLIYRLDGESNTKLIKFIYNVWKSSKFIVPDEKQIPVYKEVDGPLFLPYESEKWAGFYFSNAKVKFTKQDIKVDFKTGNFKDVEVNNSKFAGGKGTKKQEIVAHYTYHPFYPVYIKNVETQDTLITFNSIIPAFMLYANEDKAFWHNFVKTGEYILDVATTFSGIGNLAKFRHLAKLGKVRSIIAKVKLGAGIVEVTSGTTNLLLKLTNVADSELGKAISEYLFWLELLSLSGELTAVIKGGLRKSAKALIDENNVKYLDESLDDLVKRGEIDNTSKKNVIKEVEDIISLKKNSRVAYVEGLYDSIDPTHKPNGFDFEDVPNLDYGEGIATIINYSSNQKGYFIRNYDSLDSSFIFNHGFLQIIDYEKLPTWIKDVEVPLDIEKGIPTQTYFTLRQMKLLNIPNNGIKKVKMSSIQNLETMGYLSKVSKEKGINDFTKIDVLKAPSMNYVKTTMEQAGYHLKNAKIILTDITDYADRFELKNFYELDLNNEIMTKYNIDENDKLLINFNIEIETSPLKKE